ncbi:SMC-Scp complex subunit ScpB [Alkalihalobacillus sp. LMS39]|uniref:SMC-Scp complex subunit ScpB n=1 Tax=Alkalihalobacillus sp. LMS39 TaxID=2924032 RepID=UPI001FB2D567|nr:SMC-Scp complex subunit ScpB [Alkalihalobacillus sp. LMS39]UOE92433.1 SMC-Scp complex subunit ScpB [Alkalihalobacillus sp. LMS39]
MTLKELKGVIEGLLFAAGDEGLTCKQIAEVMEIEEMTIMNVLSELMVSYQKKDRGIQLVEVAGTYQLATKREHADFFKRLAYSPTHTGLSQAALETLAIIAYKQPITRIEVEEVRGVKSEKSIQTLVTKLLIKEVGRVDGTGRAILYGTTKEFLDYFGLNTIENLPPLPEAIDELAVEEEADLFFKKFEETLDGVNK